MKYALYLGCSVPVRALNYEVAARNVAKQLGIEFVDLPDAQCCGFVIQPLDYMKALAMAVRTLAMAEKEELDVCTLCSTCTSFLTEANEKMKKDKKVRGKVNDILRDIGLQYNGGVEVKHYARMLYEDIGVDKIRGRIKKNLDNLKVAVHYGCHYLKPSKEYGRFDDPEDPKTIDELVEATGTETVDYRTKRKCCGGAVLGINENISLTMSNEKLAELNEKKIDALVLVCPFCGVMYDHNQRKIQSTFEKEYNIPVLYYPQLLGLAMGLSPDDVGLKYNRVKPTALIEKLDLKEK